jgi:hypothetical protein
MAQGKPAGSPAEDAKVFDDRLIAGVLHRSNPEDVTRDLDHALAAVKAGKDVNALGMGIGRRAIDAIENDTVDPAIEGLRGLTHGKLMPASAVHGQGRTAEAMRQNRINSAMEEWADAHREELAALATESPAFRASLDDVVALLDTLEGQDFSSVESAQLALAPLKEDIRKHNKVFHNRKDRIEETPIKTVEMSLRGKKFSLALTRFGSGERPTKVLNLVCQTHGKDVPSHDDLYDIMTA